MSSADHLIFFVNGSKVDVPNPDPEMTLLEYLRLRLQLTGTKLGCGEGGCGACTVMLSRYDPDKDRIHHYSATSCLIPICSLHGLAVTTVEGVGSLSTRLHPVQEKLASAHGTQCGFCTPGFVMSMYTLLRNYPVPTQQQLEKTFDGNLCRCTGYRPIIDGYRPFAQVGCGKGENCCMNTSRNKNSNLKHVLNGQAEMNGDTMTTTMYDPTQEPIFPPYLKAQAKQLHSQSLKFVSDRVTWYRPTSLTELLDIKRQHPNSKFVVGNTEIGLEIKKMKQPYPVLMMAANIPELLTVEHTEDGIRFGSSVTLATMENILQKTVNDQPEFKTRVFSAFVEMLRWFAGSQVRNVACLGGNIMTASPISDLNPLLMACGAKLRLLSTDGITHDVVMDSQFFPAYRKTIVRPSEILLSICIPYTRQGEYFYGFKQANRKEDDTSIVNAGMRILLDEDCIVQEAAFAFGGMAPTTVMATRTSNVLIGQKWNEELLLMACQTLAEDLPLSAEAPGGMIQYRRSLSLSFFFRCYLHILQQLHKQDKAKEVPLPSSYVSAVNSLERDVTSGTQVFEAVAPDQDPQDALHRPLVHQSAYKQASGEAIYVDDIPVAQGELYMGCVLSTQSHARLVRVDPSLALAMPGVVDFISYRDLPASNIWGLGNEIFAEKEVSHQGQIIGVVLAENKMLAQRAAAVVVVEYEPLEAIITIKPEVQSLSTGDLSAGFEVSEQMVEGEIHVEAQEHFYLETIVALIRPGEDGEMEIFASVQNPAGVQETVAKALNVDRNKIVVRTKRVGGAFGGKQARTYVIILPMAIAARKLKRAVRCSLDRDEDMKMSATGHPLYGTYKAGVTSDGKLQALQIDMYINGGATAEVSPSVIQKALYNTDNCYKIPNLCTTGRVCKTNLPSNTAFRGFGGPQVMLLMEACIDHISSTLNLPPEKIREANFYKEGDITHYNQKLEQVTLQRCWAECLERSDYDYRRQQVDAFNRDNRWRKRGLAVIPTKYGIGFTLALLNQGSALVNIYADGSVLISHGGVEMGQGLYTKMIQVASRVLRVPTSRILISDCNTGVIPNASVTAASMSSDIYGEAVKEACEKLRDRLDQHQKSCCESIMTWDQLVMSAYKARISLSASGFHSVPGLGFDAVSKQGRVFSYFSFGVACSEVEIDCLTGDHKVIQTDIVMDAGKSLNPTIDIGQIEGAFVQGYGMMMLEQYKVRPDGTLLTVGPGTYKIPSVGNTPEVFNVFLLRNSNNPRAVFSSKNTGEPPFFLAASVLHAVQDAVSSARRDAGLQPIAIRLDSPATPDRIRLACADQFTKQFDLPTLNGPATPWYVDL